MIVVVSVEGHVLAAVRVDAAPRATHQPDSEQVLPQFCHIVAVAFLPAVGKPLFGINFHTENTLACLFRQGW